MMAMVAQLPRTKILERFHATISMACNVLRDMEKADAKEYKKQQVSIELSLEDSGLRNRPETMILT
jgi:hypothetical protein